MKSSSSSSSSSSHHHKPAAAGKDQAKQVHHPATSDINLLPVLNKIAQLSVDTSSSEFLSTYKQALDPTAKEEVIKESKIVFSTYSPLSPLPLVTFLESKISELTSLQDTLHGLGSQLKQLSKQENTLLQQRIKLNQTIEALAASSQRYQEICRAQQRKNKSTTKEVERLAREEVERTSKLRESCEESLRDVRVSVEAEEHLLGSKQVENEQLRVRIKEFKSHLIQRKQQLEAYKKSKELQAQIDETKKQRFQQMQNHHELQRQAYESNLDRQRNKIKEVEEQIKII
jgi:chromosome segregation ATPase